MADFSFSDDKELQSLSAQVLEDPGEFAHWEKLVRAAEQQEGKLSRNSSPQAIAATRETYDRFLAQFPLFFGYWKKYADLEFAIAGPEAAEMVYERGIASIGTSVDLWTNYCGFKTETNHDTDAIEELFERGAECVGFDFLSHPFWDKYLEYEERIENTENVFKILFRIIQIPLHQYARYFERYRNLAANMSTDLIAPKDVGLQFHNETLAIGGSQEEQDRTFRQKVDAYHLEIFQRTQTEVTRRWTYESAITRPYYHVTPLDDAQLENWRKYLDFEEAEPHNYSRAKFLYERCLVTAANYEEFWLRYAKWMMGQGKVQEVRNIYQRASCLYVPTEQPTVRIQYAKFEESKLQLMIAEDIYKTVLEVLPNDLETITNYANFIVRQSGVDNGIVFLKKLIRDKDRSVTVRGTLVAEWARMVWELQGDAEGARNIWKAHSPQFLACKPFWDSWFFFERNLPSFGPKAPGSMEHVKSVYGDMENMADLPVAAFREITSSYLNYLDQHGGRETMKFALLVDRDANGPTSVLGPLKAKVMAENGVSGIPSHPAAQAVNGQASNQ